MKYSVRQQFRETPADQTVVTVSGWVRTLRDSKVFAFIELNDGTFFKNLQVVVSEEKLPDYKDINVSDKVVKIIQSYVGVVNKMVWRKDI